MTGDEREPADSAPIYPPASRGGSDSSTDDEPTTDRSADRSTREAQLTDREVPRRPANDFPQVAQTALFESPTLDEFNGRWSDIQASFVDEPRSAVQQADALVADVIKQIGSTFSKQRQRLEEQWDRNGDVSTEDLRQTLQRYRSFFSRLLGL